MSIFYILLIIAFLVVVIVFLVRAFRRYGFELPPLLPTSQRPPVEARSRVYHGIFPSKPRSGFLDPQNGDTIHSQRAQRKNSPPLPPRPVAVRKPQQYGDDIPVVSIGRVHRHASTKAPGQKTVKPPLTTVYPPSPELPSRARRQQQYSISRNELPGALIELSRGGGAARQAAPPYFEPQPSKFFESQDEEVRVNDKKGGDGDDDLKDLDHPALRELANQEWENMKKCRTEEKLARKSRQFIRAREPKIKAQQHRKRMQELNDRASEVVFAENNKDPTLREIDLHGLTVKEAIDHTNRVLKQARELENSEMRIIVGKGIHSKDGQAKLKPAIRTFLEKNQFPVEVDPRNDGVLVARLDAALGF